MQILYYRKDLFESPICKRTYFEQFHEELQPPKTFEEYNRIAAFFTRDLTPSSPVPYGSTITLGSTGVAGSEFLARLFAIQENLYGADGQIHLDSLQCQQALAGVSTAAALYIAGVLWLVDPDCKAVCRRKFCHVHFVQQLCQ